MRKISNKSQFKDIPQNIQLVILKITKIVKNKGNLETVTTKRNLTRYDNEM